jgi:hypothetical protein
VKPMLRTVNPQRLVSRLPQLPSRGTGRPSSTEHPALSMMARAFNHSQGAGLLGPGTDGLLRTLLIDALINQAEPANVILTRTDLERLFHEDLDRLPLECFGAGLHVTATLEDAIEFLEQWAGINGCRTLFPMLWIATPHKDADVVHNTLTALDGVDIVALLNGSWPYGPTYLIEPDGPRPVPNKINLLSAEQALGQLQAIPAVARKS